MTVGCLRYLALLEQLLTERQLEGGALSDGHEAEFAARLSELWWALSEGEHELVEQHLAAARWPDAPLQLDTEDQAVCGGERRAPRRAA